ncbi:hypothetical protein [Neoroseomonas soli]|uniref:Uncharacterized protein n=1 Tax=Neoroseomonas soli TaxID=1081025 RepID=A0A9X9WR96_9PROT|nr:hypothetical protein [Neoroseomonas soli]MBR0669675.1 hypothetical protein [Neoroseomonas soli]
MPLVLEGVGERGSQWTTIGSIGAMRITQGRVPGAKPPTDIEAATATLQFEITKTRRRRMTGGSTG